MSQKNQKYERGHRMRDLIRSNPSLLPALSRFGIAPGFGDNTVEAVCAGNGVDTGTFLAVANFISGHPADTGNISLPSLMGYLRSAHNYFLNYILPTLRMRLVEALSNAANDDITLMILRFYDDYALRVREHMDYEDRVVFTYVDRLLAGELDSGFSIDTFRENHSPIASKLRDLKEIFITHYHAPGASAERVNTVLFNIIQCETDLMAHCRVEDAVFIPAVARLETEMRTRAESRERDAASVAVPVPDVSACLTGREKDIVKCVARGLSNKEIANALCLSVHTVTTHRRNISAKLDIHSQAGLAVYAIVNRLVDLSEVKAR